MTLGQRIKIAREKRGLTQVALGAKLGVTDKAVSNWERGVDTPEVEKLMPLAGTLKVPVSWLLDGGSVVPPADDIQTLIEALDSHGRLTARTVIEGLVVATQTAKADEKAS